MVLSELSHSKRAVKMTFVTAPRAETAKGQNLLVSIGLKLSLFTLYEHTNIH